MDALDAMDDDGSPESEETHDAAVEQAAVAIPPQLESHIAGAELGQARIDQSSVEPPRVESSVPPHAQAAPTESAPLPPPAPDHADHDPQ
jgi:hypothetical protein